MAGGTKSSYLAGCLFSSSAVTGIQLGIILMIWSVFDGNFTLSVMKTGILYIYILIVSNLYGILVTMVSKSEMMAGILGSSGAVLFSILGGTFVAVDNMPKILQAFSMCSPVRWLIELI